MDLICFNSYPNGLSAFLRHFYCSVQNKSEYRTHCLKVTEKVSFNIARETSCVYILIEQKFITNAKNGHFGDFFFEKLKRVVK